jgi:hypothetical protein
MQIFIAVFRALFVVMRDLDRSCLPESLVRRDANGSLQGSIHGDFQVDNSDPDLDV